MLRYSPHSGRGPGYYRALQKQNIRGIKPAVIVDITQQRLECRWLDSACNQTCQYDEICAVQPTALESLLGDINNDGQLDAADLLLLQRSIVSGAAL